MSENFFTFPNDASITGVKIQCWLTIIILVPMDRGRSKEFINVHYNAIRDG
jgi:hypothetical protein